MTRLGTTSPAGQRGEVILVGEARHGIVGLRLEPAAPQPTLGRDAQHGHRVGPVEPRGREPRQVVHEGCDEHRLARARQAGHAQPQRPARERIREALSGDTGLERNCLEQGQEAIPARNGRLNVGRPSAALKRRP